MPLNFRNRFRAGTRKRRVASSIAIAACAVLWRQTGAVAADLPVGEQVASGTVTISRSGSTMQVNQATDKAIINWQGFDIGSSARVNFTQPSVTSAALNRVVTATPSTIEGTLTSNGQVFLVNPAGIIFGKGSSVNVGGLVASTMSIGDDDFNKGNLRFNRSGATGSILNQGTLTAAEGGLVALLGTDLQNDGVISARLGTVALAAGETATLSFGSDSLFSVAVDQATVATLIKNHGIVQADGGSVIMHASTAGTLVASTINTDGMVIARGIGEKDGKILLLGDTSTGSVTITGKVDAGGATPTDNGGSITAAGGFIALGGDITADGKKGGTLSFTAAGTLSLAENVHAKGLAGDGGTINYYGGGRIFETNSSITDVSGTASGGSITVESAKRIASSGAYLASGSTGLGGRIDMTAPDLRLLATKIDASGGSGGGLVRIGGPFQGGKAPSGKEYETGFTGRWGTLPYIASATQTFVNDGTTINLSSAHGAGGTAVIWSSTLTTALASIDARGATAGGFVELSSAATLRQASLLNVHVGGGTLLLDPKDIVIGEPATVQSWNYAGILGAFATSSTATATTSKNVGISLDSSGISGSDLFGGAVSLNAAGDRLAVGAPGDDGYNNSLTDSGAVYLFTFTDTSFSGGALQGIIGSGYTGGKNVSQALDTGDAFGFRVSLNAAGDRLAVGAPYEDGYLNAVTDSGAVYLFSFADTSFTGGTRQAIIGNGYGGLGGKNVSITLEANDWFGVGVSLNAAGDRLAVSAPVNSGGRVYLFSFADTNFTGATLESIIGAGYTGDKNISVAIIPLEEFGWSVALNAAGDRLAVGARFNGGPSGSMGRSGAAYLFSFSDTSFSGGALQSIIGAGYTGGKNYNLALNTSDWFGNSVSLNAAGDRLAVSAPVNSGGRVYLFSFADTNFTGATLESIIGSGSLGGKNIGVSLDEGDYFGYSVSLNGAGDRLAVGSRYGDGLNNAVTDSGEVSLFTFQDSSFTGGSLAGTMGAGYSAAASNSNIALPVDRSGLAGSDRFGSGVALNAAGDRLAVGAYGDDGYNNSVPESGAVYLFTFTDTNFAGASLAGIMGSGYTGGKNVNVALDTGDLFGYRVSLNAAGDRLAVGAYGDAGYNNSLTESGAVYLFTFADTSFSSGAFAGIMGAGYTGGKSVNVALDTGDVFGFGVSLNAAGDRLAASALYDDGYNNLVTNSGAAYLFSFSDTSFSGGKLESVIGAGYTGGKNLNLPLIAGENFGISVALNAAGDRLAVGARYNGGPSGSMGASGAAYLFSFSDISFSGGALQSIIGAGYTGGKNYNLPLGTSNQFGYSVALNAAGDRLAVSAPEMVYLFSFADTSFTGATLESIIGNGSFSGKNVAISLEAGDQFGVSVSLNAAGDRLAVGAPLDDGYNNLVTDSGAVYLFTFTDTNFTGGTLAGTMGAGYAPSTNNNIALPLDSSGISGSEEFGRALSVNAAGDRLAVGAPLDDGFNNLVTNSGAVYLFSFSDTNFTGGTLAGIIGSGYTGGKNVNVALDTGDAFGYRVSLNAAGDRLAVGAYGDDGNLNAVTDSGAVYLFTFSDTSFTGGALAGTIGAGYTGGKNVNVALGTFDLFGAAVSLNAAGNLLAVGAYGDDGNLNAVTDSGAVYLFTFQDTSFSGGTLAGTIGYGYTGPKDVNVALETLDNFGIGVSLNAAGNQLAVGALFDDGYNNLVSDSGSVYLFNFQGTSFSGGTLAGIIGDGYTGGKNVNILLGTSDVFGGAVSLNAAGDRLAVGAQYDAGYGNSVVFSGSVYLFTFSDTSFTDGTLAATIGNGYTGAKDIGIPLGTNDYFGTSVSLNAAGNLLAVGARGDDGYNNLVTDSGAVYLFTFTDTSFSGGKLAGIIGSGYTPSAPNSNVSMALDPVAPVNDLFGQSLSLNAAGDRLAVGAPLDDGFNNVVQDSGAVYLFTFSDTNFTGGTLAGIIGSGYTGG